MNRRQRLKWLCTRRGMRAAARRQFERRGAGQVHRFIVGGFRMVEGRVMLAAVMCGPAYDVPRPPVLTVEACRFNRWRTKQAAHQFAARWELNDCHVFSTDRLDVPRAAAGAGPGEHISGIADAGR